MESFEEEEGWIQEEKGMIECRKGEKKRKGWGRCVKRGEDYKRRRKGGGVRRSRSVGRLNNKKHRTALRHNVHTQQGWKKSE